VRVAVLPKKVAKRKAFLARGGIVYHERSEMYIHLPPLASFRSTKITQKILVLRYFCFLSVWVSRYGCNLFQDGLHLSSSSFFYCNSPCL